MTKKSNLFYWFDIGHTHRSIVWKYAFPLYILNKNKNKITTALLPSFLSYSLKTVSRVRSRELNSRPPALQSNALPTELILSGLIIPESRSLPCYSFNASGSPLEDFILYFWSEAGASAIFLNHVNKDL